MSGFFRGVKGIVIVAAKASKTAVLYTYNTAREAMLPIFVYIAVADVNALFKEAYKSGMSARTRQKLMYVALNLTTTLGMYNSTENEVFSGRVNALIYTPTAAGLIIKKFSRQQRKKMKLALTLKNNSLLKEMITENVGVFDPQVVLSRGSTALVSRDPLQNAYAEQVQLFDMLERMRLWHEVFKTKPDNSPDWGNKELSCREVTEQPLQENAGLLGEGLAAINENE